MTPSPVAPQTQATWESYASSLPQGIPDHVYDAAREHFFQSEVLPAAMQGGHDITQARSYFMQNTERPDKSNMPRAAVFGHQVLESLGAPLLGMMGDSGENALAQLQRETGRANTEAERQGVNQEMPVIGHPMNFLGQAAGMAPYFGMGEALAGPVLEAARASKVVAGLGPIKEALHAATIGSIQGAYDAASAQAGQKTEAFGKGFASGAALGGGFELLGGLSGILRQAHDITPEQASGIEAVAKGNPTPEQVNHATAATLQDETVADTVGKATQVSQAAAAKLGVPVDIGVEVDQGSPKSKSITNPDRLRSSKINVSMLGADGKPYQLGGENGLSFADVDNTLELISNHLSNGGQIVSLQGQRGSIQDFLRRVEKSTVPEEYKLPIRSLGDPSIPATVGVKTELPGTDATPRASRPLRDAYVTQYGETAGTWVTPKGKVQDVETEHGVHPGIEQLGGEEGAINSGWIRTRDNSFQTNDLGNSNVAQATMQARKYADADDPQIYVSHPGGDFTIPTENIGEFLANPKKYARMNQGRSSTQLNLADVPNYDNFLQLPSGEVLNKQTGEVHPNLPDANYTTKETPIGTRIVGNHPMVDESTPGMSLDTTRIYHPSADRATIVHEKYHGLTSGLDMHDDVMNLMDDPTTKQLYRNVFDPETQAFYGRDPFIYREEVFAHSMDAVRTNNIEKIQQFIDGDTDRNTYMQWIRDKTAAHLDIAAQKPDSIYKRQYERLLNDVQNRATRNINDIATYYSQASMQPELSDGDWATRDDTGVTRYGDRESALTKLQKNEPSLNTPELVDDTKVDPETLRFARNIRPPDGKPPVGDKPLPEPLIKQARGGLQLLSHYIRPFYAWLDTVSQRNNWPELYDSFKAFDNSQIELNNFQKPFYQLLKDGLAGYEHTRQVDFFKWFQTDDRFKSKVEEALGFQPDEIQMLQDLQTHVLDPLENKFGVSLQDLVRGAVNTRGADPVIKKLAAMLDPKQEDLLWQAGKYLETGARASIVDSVLDQAEEVVNQRFEDKTYRAGDLRPLLNTKIDALRGVPDYTNKIVQGALEGAVELINRGFDRVNAKLPDSMQLPKIDHISDDPLGKFTLFQYAGTLGLKPATLVRDGMQYFLTTLPIAGKYAGVGLRKVFPALRMGSEEARNLWDTASKYGALIERSDIKSLYAASSDEAPDIGEGKAAKFAKWSLSAIQFSHNANRLAAFWGHSEQALDALAKFKATGDLDKFNRESALWFLDKSERDNFNQELANPDLDTKDLAHRIAARVTEVSQWNMRRGATPGIYSFSLGRLFGQYGTWPLNYIEYARRFAAASDKVASAKALTTLAIAHGAVLVAGQSVGIDSGRWTFTAPASDWQGGPLFEQALNAPRLLDFETAQGDEARSNLREQIFPGMVPAGEEAARIYEALATNDPNTWVKILGFHAMENSDYNRGIHQLIPR